MLCGHNFPIFFAKKLGEYLNLLDGVGTVWFDDVELLEEVEE